MLTRSPPQTRRKILHSVGAPSSSDSEAVETVGAEKVDLDTQQKQDKAADQQSPSADMSSPRRSARGSGPADPLAAKRQRAAELQKLVAAERAAVQGAATKTKELNEARRILEAAKHYSRHSKLIGDVLDLPDGRGQRLVSEHAEADRARKARITQLEQRLSAQLARQRELQLRLEQLRTELPPASQARQRLRQAQNDPDLQREYTDMLEQYGNVTHLYNILEKLMVTSGYPWLDSREWMDRIRPAYHALEPPSHVLRADPQEGSAEGGAEGSSEAGSDGGSGSSEGEDSSSR